MKSVDEAIRILNEALAADPVGINALFSHEVAINKVLAEHPTIQVWSPTSTTDHYRLRCLGLINGLFGVDERKCGYIAAEYEDKIIVGFKQFPQS